MTIKVVNVHAREIEGEKNEWEVVFDLMCERMHKFQCTIKNEAERREMDACKLKNALPPRMKCPICNIKAHD